ncbi:hypothetical protein H8356DRAFT_1315632 [Neocallimastix lanati (nom. inval.)]|uniref:Uncharacterized protein n=1 Tax=Neocallimastix californiae TaxID=1754190 RepID=A0A1Y2BSJ4_9FUNG|nr:hypothetical protein H8356DRAFT_1315632 [Neocallimastix sp. JGI-2020a]ORY37719.1 hypothetical protein LY90DRAFT_511129 [Neocallimastix californiae]|eukprot:ORY37719.1 hypothetical protein LY90DRAFT_511129 [Neocallimastix californiae]
MSYPFYQRGFYLFNIDFMTDSSDFSNNYQCCGSIQSTFVEDVVNIFLKDIFSLSEFPLSIISYLEIQFTLHFWKKLMSLLTDFIYSNPYQHQVERLKGVITQTLRCITSEELKL